MKSITRAKTNGLAIRDPRMRKAQREEDKRDAVFHYYWDSCEEFVVDFDPKRVRVKIGDKMSEELDADEIKFYVQWKDSKERMDNVRRR